MPNLCSDEGLKAESCRVSVGSLAVLCFILKGVMGPTSKTLECVSWKVTDLQLEPLSLGGLSITEGKRGSEQTK